jgi:MFS family permease
VLLLGLVHYYPAAVVFLVGAGLCLALNAIMTNTVLQTSAPDHVRGQVVGLYSFIVIGLAPFGSLQAAWIGEQFGPSRAIALGGTVCLGAALWVGRRAGIVSLRFGRRVPAAQPAGTTLRGEREAG